MINRRLFVIVTGLHNLTGHEYGYTQALYTLEHRRRTVVVWGRRDATPDLTSKPWFRGVFSKIEYNRADDPPYRHVFNLWRRESAWYREMSAAIVDASIGPGDVLFCHTFSVFSICQWLLLKAEVAKCGARLVLLFRYSPSLVPWPLRSLYRWAYRQLKPDASLALLTDSALLAEEYRAIAPHEMQVVPNLYDHLLESAADTAREPTELPTVTYLGSARSNKGFALLPDLVKHISKTLGPDQIQFVFQCTVSGTDVLEAACVEPLLELKALRKQYSNLRLVENHPNSADYQRLLMLSDAVLVLYTGSEYRTQTSGILTEALHYGKHCVVPDNTWMSSQVRETGIGIVLSSWDINDISDAVVRAVRSSRIAHGEPHRLAKWLKEQDPLHLLGALE